MKNITIPKSVFSEVYLGAKTVLTKDNPTISQTKFDELLHQELIMLSSNLEHITYKNSNKYCYNHYMSSKAKIGIDFGVFFLLMSIIAKENDVQFDKVNFAEGFKKVFYLLSSTTDEQINKIEAQYKNHSFSQSEEKKHTLYRCYYYYSKNNDTVSFFTKVDFNEGTAEAVKTQSGHDFRGNIVTKEISVGTSLLLRNKHEENKRVLHILLSDGHIDFSKRELSIGLFLNINDGTQLEGGVTIFEKIDEELNQKSVNDLINEYKVKSIPESIRFYLAKKEYRMVDNDVSTLKSLRQRLSDRYPYWTNLKKITKRIVGIYKCFTIGRDGNIDTNYFLFKSDGSFKCNTNDFHDYHGYMKIESSGTILLSMQAGNHQPYYKIFINLSQKLKVERIQKLKAIYAGIAIDNQPKGGRCYFIRMTEAELKETIERCLQENSEFNFDANNEIDKDDKKLIDKIYSELNNAQYEILFKSLNVEEGKDISKLEPQDIELTSFLSGVDNQLIEDGSNLLIENIRFPNSNHELLSELSGIYEYYRTSGYKENALVKKYSLQIHAKGRVTVHGNHISSGQGLVYNDYFFIHLFNTEKHIENYTSPDYYPKKYGGVAVFRIDKKRLDRPMLGVYQSFNADEMMVVGRIILIRSKTGIVGEPHRYRIRTPEFDLLNIETNGIAKFLTGQANNLINYSTENTHEIKRGKPLSKTLNIGMHLFDSACWKAINKDNKNALDALNQAILNGFDDKERFSKELEGAFKHIEKEAIDLWDSHIPD